MESGNHPFVWVQGVVWLLAFAWLIYVLGRRQESAKRKQAEAALRESREHYRSLFEGNPHPMWVYDIETLRFLAVNDAALQHYGYSLEEFLSMTIKDIRPAEDVPLLVDTIAKLGSGLRHSGRWRHRKKDGTLIDVEVMSHGIQFGTHPARFVLVSDVTETQRTLEALRRSEEKYRDLFENANDAIFIVDSGLRYVDVNNKGVELLGYSRDELLAMRILDLIPPEQVPRSSQEFEKLRNRGAYEKFVGKVRTRDGRWLDVEVSSSAIMTDGKIAGSRDIMRDITVRKKMEDDLLRAQKLESLGVLAGGLAHDFNNLLTAVLGNIMLAKMDSRPGDGRQEWLEEAERASYRARDLTQQLLTFSRGGAPIKRTIALDGLIRDAASFSLRGSHSRCEMTFPDALLPVEADEGQLSQVINNLVINAVQAMPEGGTVRISCENTALGADSGLPLPAGNYVKVSIVDRGVGIPPEHLKTVFDPYFTTKEKGSGLGLATSYSIIKRHEGHISVESQVGVGTTFSIFLPASTADVRTEAVVEHRSIRGTGRVLVVDDEPMIREVASKILASQGYEVESAPDGQIALVRYAKARQQGNPFDVVILDLTIPGGLGGKETIKKLLEIDPQARAIVSSGYSNDPIMAQFNEYGFKGVAAKPYTIKILSQAVHDAMHDGHREP
ncbi:MAG: hypothetical protein A2X58_03795 [Nitrospirae bacterium GWC2_56_14]|nr:MAG: hypothetical protein A2X58_03795 [Nitrospirae bacterium GWC2_56_14]